MISRIERATSTADLIDELAVVEDPARRDELVDDLILVNRRVAEAIAGRYRDRGLARDDLVQVAYEGLTKAARRFDPHSGNNFLTFAVPTIRGELQRHFRDRGWTVRPPRRVQELQWRINQTTDALSHDLGRHPSHQEIVTELGVTQQSYAEALAAFGCFSPASLDMAAGHDTTTTMADLLPGAIDIELNPMLDLVPVVRHLSERDRRILYLRFFEDRTQTEIGVDLGVTQMQVSRLLQRILGTLRSELGDGSDRGTTSQRAG